MTAPFVENWALAEAPRLALALGIGVGFGWMLERAGLGSARKLVSQFYLTDLTVFKVMFSAVVTAMLGTFWMARLGVLDLSLINANAPETFLWPQLVGGLVFGIGFAAGGLCPGTACVAAASGRIDGFAAIVGIFSGVLSAGLALESAPGFYAAGARGSQSLADLTGLSSGVVVFLVTCAALAGFAVAEAIERRKGV